jgi:hypothetical protein
MRWVQARIRAGLSSRWAAEMTGIDIGSIESGSTDPTESQLRDAARVYGVSECWLSGHQTEIGPGFNDAVMTTDISGRDVARISDLLHSISSCRDCIWTASDH